MPELLACLIAHVVAAGVCDSPWWVPDLTLIGLALAVGRRPDSWPLVSGVGAASTAIWAVRFPVPLLAAFPLLGWLMSVSAKRWDLADVRVQILVVCLACGSLTGGLLWLEGLWSWPLTGLAVIHVVVTGLTTSVVHRLSRAPQW